MKTKGSASGMFLIEILLALLIFAIASAICLQVFVTSHQIAADSNTLNRAVVAAQNGAECFKAAGGDLKETAKLLSGYEGYNIEIKELTKSGGLVTAEVNVSDASGNLIFSVPVSAMEVGP